jgi:hypothetical protein
VVDTQVPEAGEAIAQAISQIFSGPLRFFVNTSSGDNQTGGNESCRVTREPCRRLADAPLLPASRASLPTKTFALA